MGKPAFLITQHEGKAGDDGLVIPVHDRTNERLKLLANSLEELRVAAALPLTPAPWSATYIDEPVEQATLQGLIRDASGELRATNAVLLRWPR